MAKSGFSASRDAKRVHAGQSRVTKRHAATGKFEKRVEAVLLAAERSGLIADKSGRIAGRVSTKLVRHAKDRTGIEADTDLIEFALANLALEDKFAEAFKAARGKVDPDLRLGF